MGRNATFRVTSVCGHVFSIDFEDQFNNWEKTDPAELFSAGTKKDEANPKMRIGAHLKNESRDASDLVLWLDCDREGENICYEVIQCCKNIPNKNIRRAHFSAIVDKDIKAAMNNLGLFTIHVLSLIQELCRVTQLQTPILAIYAHLLPWFLTSLLVIPRTLLPHKN